MTIIHCKDCRYSWEYTASPEYRLYCTNHLGLDDQVNADDYCSYAKKKED